jgi:sulfonate transport system permease protein
MSASTDDITIFPQAPEAPQESVQLEPLLDAVSWGGQALLKLALALILPLAIYGLWWITAERHWIAEQILPSPAFVWESFNIVWDSGELIGHVKYSAARAGWSLLIGGGAGLVLGFAMGLSSTIRAYIFPTFNALAQLPVLGWIPLLIIFVGIEEALKLSAISIAVVVPVTLNTLQGIGQIPKSLLEVGQVYGFTTRQVITRIVLPATVPSLFTGLRQGVMQAWLTVIFVELLSSSEGLGFFMAYSRAIAQIDMVIVAMFVIGAAGVVLELALRLIESRLATWRRTAF